MKKTTSIVSIAFISLFLLFSGCKTAPVVIPDEMTPAEFFQKAQEASNNGKYETALNYYNTFLERYPDDTQRDVEAEYEIAFIAYKQHNYTKARELFNEILKKYSTESSQVLPAWPKILSQKVLSEMEDTK